MKAIETTYNGYRFRSRLEARWAVFFKYIHLDYEYEKEGFTLENGLSYLPDFYIPSMDLYIEIKPSFSEITMDDALKMECFGNNKQLMVIIGSPGKQEMYYLSKCVYNGQINEYLSDGSYDDFTEFLEGMYQSFEEVDFAISPFNHDWTICYKDLRSAPDDYDYKIALLKARQARFEFGEKG
ncbi:MAG: hypothetical protein ACLU30_00550 [Odoribacter splanchnicus]